MRYLKPCLAAVVALATMYAPVSFADADRATQASTTSAQNFADASVEDMVAIAKAGQQNEAINDAVLGNDAIRESLPQLGDDRAVEDIATANSSSQRPVNLPQSSAKGVAVDKLILNSPVVDQANILSTAEKQRLTGQLRALYDQGLAQAAVIIVPTTNGVPIFDYALQAAEKWQLGEADTDDGLLILVAVNDRNMYILSGYGLEGVLPDAVLNRIIDDDITPFFKQGDYAAGLTAGINRIEERLTTDPDILAQADAQAAQRSQRQSGGDEVPSPIFLFIMALIFGSFITSIFGRVLGSILTTGGFFMGSLALGGSFIMTLIMAIFLWIFLISRGGGGRGGRGGGGFIVFPGGSFSGGGGGFGGGGFGGGGFGGGGGGFGGGGAGGSW